MTKYRCRECSIQEHCIDQSDTASSVKVTIGRSDPDANFRPSLDLTQDGNVVAFVSRCHAIITWNNHCPYVTDLQSTFGTRLNGELLVAHQAVALKPGDHMSLAGCVLAYDIELSPGSKPGEGK